MTGSAARALARGYGTDVGLFAATVLEAAEDPANPTYTAWIDFAEDVFRAIPMVGPPATPGSFYGTSDDVLTDVLDLRPLDPNLAAAIDALPPAPLGPVVLPDGLVGATARTERLGTISSSRPRPSPETLPADLPGLVREVRSAAICTSSVYASALALGERTTFERGDGFASGYFYRSIVAALVAERAGDIPGLADLTAGAWQAVRAVQEARALSAEEALASGVAGGGTGALASSTNAVEDLKTGIGVLTAALDAANGDSQALANLDGRLHEMVYRIHQLADDPLALQNLEDNAADFLVPDVVPPVVTAAPVGPLFTGSVSVPLLSDEPATIYYTLDGSDPVPGAGNTFAGVNKVAGIVITADTTLSWIGSDTPVGNTSTVARITYRSDADGDAIADVTDNCPSAFNPTQADFDLDLLGDVCDPDDDNDTFADFADCRPFDPTLWASPGTSPITLTFTSATTLQWTSLAAAAGPGTTYDLVRGPVSDFRLQPPGSKFAGAVCRLDNASSLTETDADPPAVGEARYYLTRGDNLCGMGSYGLNSGGAERVILACP
jgi:hypothetical protein